MTPLVELNQLDAHAKIFIWQTTQRTHRLARLCRLTTHKKLHGFIDLSPPSFLSQEATSCSFEDFLSELDGTTKGDVALLCDGPLPAAITDRLASRPVTLYESRYTLNLFFPPCYDDHRLGDTAFIRLWNLMLSRRGLAAAARAQEDLSYQSKIAYDAVTRPAYAYAMLRAAHEALHLGLPEISVVEFGVAGGNGLLALEEHATALERELNIKFQIFGFDCGKGLPRPTDYRDQPYLFQEGDYPMDETALRARLTRSTLLLGPVKETTETFWQPHDAPPLGAVMFDLDYYSSTMEAFTLLTAQGAKRMPRVACYFDDLSWSHHVHENVGELQAIQDFNTNNADLKIVRSINLDHMRIQPAPWNQQMFVLHDFKHPLYSQPLRKSGFVDLLDLMN